VGRRVARRVGRARRAETGVGGEQSAEVRRVGRGSLRRRGRRAATPDTICTWRRIRASLWHGGSRCR